MAHSYVSPFFHQSWSLFAPVPKSNYRLYASSDGYVEKDILQEIIYNHQKNIFAGHGPLLISMVNSLHYFEHYTAEKQKLNGPIKNNLHFEMLAHAALNFMNREGGAKYNFVKLKVVIHDVREDKMRVYFGSAEKR